MCERPARRWRPGSGRLHEDVGLRRLQAGERRRPSVAGWEHARDLDALFVVDESGATAGESDHDRVDPVPLSEPLAVTVDRRQQPVPDRADPDD
jgi:hypothetical protein